ncbi:hypothetical protein ACFWPA_01100 [Rhodococcus sp. NPDC058505]|uniref:hypothetical protein n=1 Tax=unclassified Rhodococcus (in: high G+C Gram-positive bacteria) TaxID=192944 RepID=UPI003662F00C
MYLYPPILQRIPGIRSPREPIRLRYLDGRGLLRQVLKTATEMGFSVTHIDTTHSGDAGFVRLVMDVEGRGDPVRLADRLAAIDGVFDVSAGDRDEIDDE